MRNILIEMTPIDPATGLTSTIRMSAIHAGASGTILDGKVWTPAITSGPVISTSIWDQGQPTPLTVSYGKLGLQISGALANIDWPRLAFNGTQATIWAGALGDPFTSYRKIWTGTIGPFERTSTSTATVELLGPETVLDRNLLSASYAGNGNAEGPASLLGVLKPYAIGALTNVAPVLVDTNYWIYQVDGYDACAINAVYSNALALLPEKMKGNVATYAALKALPLTPGEWAIAPAVGMFRLGADPQGAKITCDVGSASTVGAVVTALMNAAGLSASRIDASVAAATRPYYLYADSQLSILDAIRSAAFAGGKYLIADSAGKFYLSDAISTKTPGQLTSNRSTYPLVLPDQIKAPVPAEPTWRVKVGHTRVWSVHSSSEISPAIAELGDNIKVLQANAETAADFADATAADAAYTRARIETIDDDLKLDRSDKLELVRRFQNYTAERTGVLSTVNGLGLTAIATDYTTKYDNFKNYLLGLSPAWDNTDVDTPITGDLINYENAYLVARQNATNAAANAAAKVANWTGVESRPENLTALDPTNGQKLDGIQNGATVGAPAGTNINGVAVETITTNINAAIAAVATLNSGGYLDTTPPAIPTSLSLSSAMSDTGASLNAVWSASSDADFARYIIAVKEASGTFIEYTTTTPSYQLPGLARNRLYTVKIAAQDKAGNRSAFTAEASTTTVRDTVAPSAPTGVAVESSQTSVFITWTNPVASDLAGVAIYRSATNDSSTAILFDTVNAVSGAAGTHYSNLQATATYYFWLKAFDTSGNYSPFSAGVSITRKFVDLNDLTPGLTAPRIVSALPNPTNYTGTPLVFLQSDGKLYRYVSGAWTSAVAGADISAIPSTATVTNVVGANTLADAFTRAAFASVSGVPANIQSLVGTEALKNADIGVNASGQLVGIGTGNNTIISNAFLSTANIRSAGFSGDLDSTKGAPAGTLVGSQLAQDLVSDVANAKAAVGQISNDNVLSINEKSDIIREWGRIDNSRANLVARSDALGVPRNDLMTAYNAASSYLLSLSPAWNDVTTNTPIVGTTFRQKFYDFYAQESYSLNIIAQEASRRAQWDGVAGTNKPADNATSDILLASSPGSTNPPTITGNTVVGTGAAGWTNLTLTKNSFVGSATISGQLTSVSTFIGLTANTNTTGTSQYVSLNYSLHCSSSSSWLIYENGGGIALGSAFNGVTFSPNTAWQITYDGVSVKYYADNVLMRSVAASPNLKLYGAVCIGGAGCTVSRISFTSFTDNNWGSVGGTGRPADNATVGAPAGTYVGSQLAEAMVSDVASAKAAIGQIANDDVLSIAEKSDIIREWNRINSSGQNLGSRLTALGLSRSNIDFAYSTLANYLNSLSPSWSDVTANSAINGPTFRAKFQAFYDAETAAINAIVGQAAQVSTWAGVSGAEKPADYAGNSDNYLANGAFTNGSIAPWTGNFVITNEGTGTTWPAKNAAVVSYAVNENKYLFSTKIKAPPKRLHLSGWLYTNIPGNIQFVSRAYNSSGTIISYKNVYPNSSLVNVWQFVAGWVDVDANCAESDFYVQIGNAPAAGNTYATMLRVSATEPSATQGAPAGTYVGSMLAQDVVTSITNISSDNVLSKSEKSTFQPMYEALKGSYQEAANSSFAFVSTFGAEQNLSLRQAADNAFTNLNTYLTGLSPAWNDTTADTNIDGPTFRARFQALIDNTKNLVVSNTQIASSKATWGGVAGTGKPADNATVGAPSGTNVGSTAATTIETRANDPATRINQNTVTVDGGKLTAGSVTAGQIAANTITTNKLLIGDTSNYAENADFSRGNVGWLLQTNSGTAPVITASTEAYQGGWIGAASASSSGGFRNNAWMRVSPGDQLMGLIIVKSGAGSMYPRISYLNNAGAEVSVVSGPSNVANGSYQRMIVNGVVPANATQARVEAFYDVQASGFAYLGFAGLYRRATGELIVDGAISTNKMTANSINGDRITGGTIAGDKIIANSIAANQLTVQSRQVSTIGLNMRINADNVTLAWDAGQVRFLNNDGQMGYYDVLANTVAYQGAHMYFFYQPGRGVIDFNTDSRNLGYTNQVMIAVWRGGTDLTVMSGVGTSINGDRIVTGSIDAGKIKANTVISNFVLVGNTNQTLNLGDIHNVAADPAAKINSVGTTIDGGKITTGSIQALQIAANAISANNLTLSTRPLSTIGLNIRVDNDGVVRWDDGYVVYQDNNLNYTQTAVPAGSMGSSGDGIPIYVLWAVGSTNLQYTTVGSILNDSRWKHIATWVGGSKRLTITAGVGSILNGDQIVTGSLNANKIMVNTLTGNQIIAGTIQTAQLAAGAITASKLGVGSGTESIIPDSLFQDNAWWTQNGTIAGASVMPTNASWPAAQGNLFAITPPDSNLRTWYTPFFPVEFGATYRVRFYYFTNNFNGKLNVSIHMPGAQWLGLKNGGGYNPDQTTADSITATTGYVVFKEYTIINPAIDACKQWQFRFDAAFTGVFQMFATIIRVSDNTLIADGAITTSKITVNSLNADRILSGTIMGDKISTTTSLPGSITVGTTGVQIETVRDNAANSANLTWYEGDGNVLNQWKFAGNKVTKVQPNAWTANAYTRETFVGGCTVTGRLVATDSFVGISSNRNFRNSNDWEFFDYAFYRSGDGNYYAYESGANVQNFGSASALTFTNVSIVYDGRTVRYYWNGNLKREVATTENRAFGAGVTIVSAGGYVDALAFTPSADNSLVRADPAARINANSTNITPGRIQIQGGTTLNDWRNGGDSTEIRGGAIAANTIAANKLTIGSRGIAFIGLNFEWRPADNKVYWDGGLIYYMDSNGNQAAQNISAGNTGNLTAHRWFMWKPGRDYIEPIQTNPGADDQVILGAWWGGTNLNITYGGTIINGSKITTGTIAADKLSVGSLSAISANIGSLVSYNGQGGRVERDGNGTRVYYNNGNLAVKIGF